LYSIDGDRHPRGNGSWGAIQAALSRQTDRKRQQGEKSMARSLSIIGFVALAIGLLWIGQGTGAIAWPKSSFMINQLQWAGYGALLGAIGLILIWQGNR
jgi:hypothetical protein